MHWTSILLKFSEYSCGSPMPLVVASVGPGTIRWELRCAGPGGVAIATPSHRCSTETSARHLFEHGLTTFGSPTPVSPGYWHDTGGGLQLALFVQWAELRDR
jgi:hypothetical protein